MTDLGERFPDGAAPPAEGPREWLQRVEAARLSADATRLARVMVRCADDRCQVRGRSARSLGELADLPPLTGRRLNPVSLHLAALLSSAARGDDGSPEVENALALLLGRGFLVLLTAPPGDALAWALAHLGDPLVPTDALLPAPPPPTRRPGSTNWKEVGWGVLILEVICALLEGVDE